MVRLDGRPAVADHACPGSLKLRKLRVEGGYGVDVTGLEGADGVGGVEVDRRDVVVRQSSLLEGF